jgi:hypothetical protein
MYFSLESYFIIFLLKFSIFLGFFLYLIQVCAVW